MPKKFSESERKSHENKIRTRELSLWQKDLLSRELIEKDWLEESESDSSKKKLSKRIRVNIPYYCFICGQIKLRNDRGSRKGEKLYSFCDFNFYNINFNDFLTGLGYEDGDSSEPNEPIQSSADGPEGINEKLGDQWKFFLEKLSSQRNSIQHKLKICNFCKLTFQFDNKNDRRADLIPKSSIRTPSSKSGLSRASYLDQRETKSSFQILLSGDHIDNSQSSRSASQTETVSETVNNQNDSDEVESQFPDDQNDSDGAQRNDSSDHSPISQSVNSESNIESNSESEGYFFRSRRKSESIEPETHESEIIIQTGSDSKDVLYTLPVINSDNDICCLCLGHTDIYSGCIMNHHLIMTLGKNAIRKKIGDGISVTFASTSGDEDLFTQVICEQCCVFDDERVKFSPESVDLRKKVFTHEFYKNRDIHPGPIFDQNLIKTGVIANFIEEVNAQYSKARQECDAMTKIALKSQQEIDRLTNQLKQSSLFQYDELTLRKLCGISYKDSKVFEKYLTPFANTFSISRNGQNVKKLNLTELINAFFFFLKQKIDIYHLCLIINHNKGVTGYIHNSIDRKTLSLYLKKIAFILNGKSKYGSFEDSFYKNFENSKWFSTNDRYIGCYVDEVLGMY